MKVVKVQHTPNPDIIAKYKGECVCHDACHSSAAAVSPEWCLRLCVFKLQPPRLPRRSLSPLPPPPPRAVYGLPTLMVFKKGSLVADSHREGAVTKAILTKYIQDHVVAPVQA